MVLLRHDINPHHKRTPWHSGRIITETVTSETGRHAHGAMKSKEKRMRKLRSVKLSAPRPKLHRMRSRIDGQVRIMTMLGNGVVLASRSLQQGLSELGRSYPASLTVIAITRRPRASGRRESSDFISGRGSPTMNCVIPRYPELLLPHIYRSQDLRVCRCHVAWP
jgi:hypothetical protein